MVAGMGKQDGGVVENGVPAAWAGMEAKSWVGDGVLQRAGGQAAEPITPSGTLAAFSAG